jgi:hypothetical protein
MDSNHHQPDSESGGLPLADQAESRRGRLAKTSTTRPQAACADQAVLLAEDGGVGHQNGSQVAARARTIAVAHAQDQHHLLSLGGDGSVSRTHGKPRMRRLLWPLSYPAMSAPTRSRTSRLRHRRPVLCPAELWTHTEAPTGIEPAASRVEARCSIQMSYGAMKKSLVGLDGIEPVEVPHVARALCR